MSSSRPLILSAFIVYIAWYLLPHVEWRWMSEDALVVISYSGLESKLGLGIPEAWAMFGVTLVVFIGTFAFGAKWKFVFAGYFLLQILVLAPLAGIVVESGLSIALRDLSSVLIGAVVTHHFLAGTRMTPNELES